jgi:hypothetical protein
MAVDKKKTLASASPPAPSAVVAAFVPHLRIAHQIAGRVRLKLDAAALGNPALRGLDAALLRHALHGVRGVTDVQFNPLARSCVIAYDHKLIPDNAWPDLLAGRRSPAAATLFALLAASAEQFRRNP